MTTKTTDQRHTDEAITLAVQRATEIDIVSGEGEGEGTAEAFSGRRTVRAIRARLTRECCNGDRWAYVTLDGQRCDEI